MAIKVHINRNMSYAGLQIYITDQKDGKTFLAEPINLTFKEVDPLHSSEATLQLGVYQGDELLNELAQALIDAGFRDKAISKDGEINRMESHLEDMRKIAFKFVDKD